MSGGVRTGWLAAGASLLTYVGLVVWLTWPLPRHLATDLPITIATCGFETRLMSWTLGHQSQALAHDPASLLHGRIYHPAEHALLYTEPGFGALPLFAPVFLATGNPALALNVMFLVGISLTAWTLHLVTQRWTGLWSAGLVAGVAFLTTRWVTWTWIPAVSSYAMLLYLPLIIWRAASPIRSPTGMLVLAGLVALQGATSPYVAATILTPLGVLAALRLLRPATRPGAWWLIAALGLAALVLAGVYSGHALLRLEEPTLTDQTYWRGAHGRVFTIPDDLRDPRNPFAVGLPVVVVIAIGMVIALVRRLTSGRSEPRDTAWRHGVLWAVVGLTIALPPTLSVLGREVWFPPAALLSSLPAFDLMRDTHRIGIAALFGLCVLVGVAFAECVRGLGIATGTGPIRRAGCGALAVVMAGLMYQSYAAQGWIRNGRFIPFPDRYRLLPATVPDSPVLNHLRRSNGPLLELPARLPLVPLMLAAQTRAMYRSLFHPRPILNGYTSYWPRGFQPRMGLADRLPDADALTMLRQQTGLELVLVQLDLMPAARVPVWLDLADDDARSDLTLVARTPKELLFRVN